MNLFISYAVTDFYFFIGLATLMMFSICLHEFSHSLCANLCGDPTAKNNGYLTLNPLKVMGINSLLMLLFFGIAWGAVPVNSANLRFRWQRVAVSLSGVAANMILGLVLALVFVALGRADIGADTGTLNRVLVLGSILNFTMALFNLLPIPPLDGFSVARELVPSLKNFGSSELQRGAMLFLIIGMFTFGFRFLTKIAAEMFQYIVKLIGT